MNAERDEAAVVHIILPPRKETPNPYIWTLPQATQSSASDDPAPGDREVLGEQMAEHLVKFEEALRHMGARAEAAEAKVARLTEQLQHECPHGDMSWSGADQADLNDDDKVWTCDNCGKQGTRAALNGDA